MFTVKIKKTCCLSGGLWVWSAEVLQQQSWGRSDSPMLIMYLTTNRNVGWHSSEWRSGGGDLIEHLDVRFFRRDRLFVTTHHIYWRIEYYLIQLVTNHFSKHCAQGLGNEDVIDESLAVHRYVLSRTSQLI
jgi:hypothetical protein